MSVYTFVEAEKAGQDGNVAVACRLLEVSRAAYYEWSKHTPSRRRLSDKELAEAIERIYEILPPYLWCSPDRQGASG